MITNPKHTTTTFFAPHLAIKVLRPAIEFYQKAFDAEVIQTWENSDGSVHVAEMKIVDAIFHLHEEVATSNQQSPEALKATSVVIGLFTPDPDKFMRQAEATRGQVISSIQDFDYGYRQGVISDPFGHQWLLQKKI